MSQTKRSHIDIFYIYQSNKIDIQEDAAAYKEVDFYIQEKIDILIGVLSVVQRACEIYIELNFN